MTNVDVHSRWVTALRTQAKTAETTPSEPLPCPYCNRPPATFKSTDQMFEHAKRDHLDILEAMDPGQARARVMKDAVEKAKGLTDRSSDATAGGSSTLGLGTLSLGPAQAWTSPYASKKRPADSDFHARRGKNPGPPEIHDPDYSRGEIPYTIVSERTRPKHADPRLFDHKQSPKGTASPYRSTTEHSNDWSFDANRSQSFSSRPVASPGQHRQNPHHGSAPQSPARQHSGTGAARQRGLIDLQRFDSRYPGLVLQPDSRPISQEQLAAEVKSIYAGLTMVEKKCADVYEKQMGPNGKVRTGIPEHIDSDQWQALIVLHRTLLHEHHDFFLASQHPSASPALRRLAAKYTMPARMWRHGIHQFLELLRCRLPESIDYMLAFIYLAYQMVALLYETVPAFEDTWIECLGDLGRYRMAIEDDDLRDRETWTGVARSWYSLAVDKSPTIGRLYHHLAILARPNALQQLAYYCRSLTCVVPFTSARESILTLLDPVLNRPSTSFAHGMSIDTSFIQAHAILFKKLSHDQFEDAMIAFQRQLDHQIGRVTAKWKEQGVFVGVTNIAGLFDYGSKGSNLREVVQFYFKRLAQDRQQFGFTNPSENTSNQAPASSANNIALGIAEAEIPKKLEALATDFTFSRAYLLAMSTLSIVSHRIGDKNVFPHVHVLMSFLASFAPVSYLAQLIDNAPWPDLVTFLNAILKSEKTEQVLSTSIFPTDHNDDVPLPEDYTIRGQVWSQAYFPDGWFAGEHDPENRYQELASTIKSRSERILRIGYHLSSFNRWISYDLQTQTFSVLSSGGSP